MRAWGIAAVLGALLLGASGASAADPPPRPVVDCTPGLSGQPNEAFGKSASLACTAVDAVPRGTCRAHELELVTEGESSSWQCPAAPASCPSGYVAYSPPVYFTEERPSWCKLPCPEGAEYSYFAPHKKCYQDSPPGTGNPTWRFCDGPGVYNNGYASYLNFSDVADCLHWSRHCNKGEGMHPTTKIPECARYVDRYCEAALRSWTRNRLQTDPSDVHFCRTRKEQAEEDDGDGPGRCAGKVRLGSRKIALSGTLTAPRRLRLKVLRSWPKSQRAVLLVRRGKTVLVRRTLKTGKRKPVLALRLSGRLRPKTAYRIVLRVRGKTRRTTLTVTC